MKDKMTPTPWHVTIDENWIYSNAGKDLIPNGGDIICLEPDMEDSKERFPANAQAIVSAVNGTYGVGVNPDAVKDLYEAAKFAIEIIDLWGPSQYGTVSADHEGELQALSQMECRFKEALQKAKL